MHLLYLIFGNNFNNYLQAYASIFSFKAKNSDLKTVNVITDHPEWFEHIKDSVVVIPLSEEQLIAWKGPYNYFWRAKIKAIETLSKQYQNEPIVYLDTDTFLYTNTEKMVGTLRNNVALMHLNEGLIKNDKTKTVKKMYKQTQALHDSSVDNLHNHEMWNAGVVASPNTKNGEEFVLALEICDFLCKNKVTDRLLEQFSLSVALKTTYGLEECQNSIAHYWSNKEEWNRHWSEFFLTTLFQDWDINYCVAKFNEQDFSKIPILKISKNTKKRLTLWVEKNFPDKKREYLKNSNHK